MNRKIYPGRLEGTIAVPASKSAAHRAVLCAALAKGTSRIENVWTTDDIIATIECARVCGAQVVWEDNTLFITGIASPPATARFDCKESGSTLRFLVPIAAALGVQASFFGEGRLPQRPMHPLTDVIQKHGIHLYQNNEEILSIQGQLQSGVYQIAGDISSQYITGLLYALPLLEGDSQIVLTSPLQSRGYVDMTVQMLAKYGIEIEASQDGYQIKGGQTYRATNYVVEGDYSGGAFWLCAGALGSSITVNGLSSDSLQGDRAILEVLQKMGTQIQKEGLRVASPSDTLQAIELDVSQIPDLLPILAATAAFAQGTSTFYGAQRLRIKESDRLQAMADGLIKLGAFVQITDDRLIVTGSDCLLGDCVVDSYADHRIAMAFSIAALRCQKPVIIQGTECVAKSYAEFYEDFQKLGGRCDVVKLGE